MTKFASRKLLVWAVCTVLFYFTYIITLLLAPTIMADWMLVAVLIMHTIVSIFYIGGNVMARSFELARIAVPTMTSGGALGSGEAVVKGGSGTL